MSTEKIPAYKCPFTGKLYEIGDDRLVGMGNPPSTPNAPAGSGRPPLILTEATEKQIKDSHK